MLKASYNTGGLIESIDVIGAQDVKRERFSSKLAKSQTRSMPKLLVLKLLNATVKMTTKFDNWLFQSSNNVLEIT